MTHAELQRYRDTIAPLKFGAMLTPFEYAPGVGSVQALAALDEALARPPQVVRYML